MRPIQKNISVTGASTGPWYPLDIYNPNQVTTISVNLLSGSANYSVEYTNEDPFDTTITQLAQAHPADRRDGQPDGVHDDPDARRAPQYGVWHRRASPDRHSAVHRVRTRLCTTCRSISWFVVPRPI
jgi:hypothetical protein